MYLAYLLYLWILYFAFFLNFQIEDTLFIGDGLNLWKHLYILQAHLSFFKLCCVESKRLS